MDKCLYCGCDTTNNNSGEHIFPAAIGGKTKLEPKYVCNKCNNKFSKGEALAFRKGVHSIPRMFYGPGKRGSLTESNKTKSGITLMKKKDSGLYELGYVSKGLPYPITQISNMNEEYKEDILIISMDKSNIKKFKNEIEYLLENDFTNKNTVIKNSEHIKKDKYIVGYYDSKVYLYKSNDSTIESITNLIKKHFSKVDSNKLVLDSLKYKESKVMSYFEMEANINIYFWIYTKIFVNFLILLYGEAVKKFQEYEKMINFVNTFGESDSSFIIQFSDTFNIYDLGVNEHLILLIDRGNELFGFVYLYGQTNIGFKIAMPDELMNGIDRYPKGFYMDYTDIKMDRELDFIEMLKYRNLERSKHS